MSYSGLVAPQAGHIGPGGWRSAPQPPQRWIRSSWRAVPCQKKAVSGVTTGRSTSAAAAGGPGRADRSLAGGPDGAGGRNFRIRNIIDATASVPTYQVLRVVTNQPSPSAVRFGPVT